MKNVIIVVVCLFIWGSVFAEDKKEADVKKPIKPEDKKVEVKPVAKPIVPKVGVVTPHSRPLPGKHYWCHPSYGWGYWYYPAPTMVPANYYLDEYGRVVPNGYVYDINGVLVPLPVVVLPVVVPPYYYYNYYNNGYYHRRWGQWQR